MGGEARKRKLDLRVFKKLAAIIERGNGRGLGLCYKTGDGNCVYYAEGDVTGMANEMRKTLSEHNKRGRADDGR